jgi:signal transduction histidine kinase
MQAAAARASVAQHEDNSEKIAAERDYYARLFQVSPVGDLILDIHGNILEGNRQARIILARRQDATLEGAFSRFLQKADIPKFLGHLRRSQAENAAVSVDLQLVVRKNRTLPVELISVPCLTTDARQNVRLRTLVIDISRRHADQATLQLTQQNYQRLLEQRVQDRTAELTATVSDLEAFSYSISHDLRAPLRAMEGYAQILQQRLADRLQPMEKEFLDRIGASAQRLDVLIQDVLRFSHLARMPLDLHRVNVEQLVEEIIRDHPCLQPPKADVELRKPLHCVRANEAFLSQCISNLLSNAVKFVKPGHHPRVRVWTEESKHGFRLCFEDNGIGIAVENHRRIFGIFQRMHSHKDYDGTGIGLAIVKKAAERMGGKVGVESALGQGSKFWLELPGV